MKKVTLLAAGLAAVLAGCTGIQEPGPLPDISVSVQKKTDSGILLSFLGQTAQMLEVTDAVILEDDIPRVSFTLINKTNQPLTVRYRVVWHGNDAITETSSEAWLTETLLPQDFVPILSEGFSKAGCVPEIILQVPDVIFQWEPRNGSRGKTEASSRTMSADTMFK